MRKHSLCALAGLPKTSTRTDENETRNSQKSDAKAFRYPSWVVCLRTNRCRSEVQVFNAECYTHKYWLPDVGNRTLILEKPYVRPRSITGGPSSQPINFLASSSLKLPNPVRFCYKPPKKPYSICHHSKTSSIKP